MLKGVPDGIYFLIVSAHGMLREERKMGIEIVGTGLYVPPDVVSNDDLKELVDTSDEWITQRIGVKERRVSKTQSAADMAAEAAKNAIADAGVTAADIDMIIATTITSDTICPTLGGSVEKAIGASCPAFDVNAACSGFVFAFDIAEKYLASGAAKRILIVSGERMSKIIDWSDRSICVIFGDGAGAAVVESGDVYSSILYTTGDDSVIRIPNFDMENPFHNANGGLPYVFMDGQETFKFAVNKIVSDIKQVAQNAGIEVSDIKHIVPHQANARIIQYAAKRLGLPIERFYMNLQHYGNTSSASVPMALAEFAKSGAPKKGDIVALTAFGGGLSSGTCVFKW